MYTTDPTLYGATLPQRELPVTTPFMPQYFGQQFPMQFPWQQPYTWQNFQRFVPPMAQGFQPPYFNTFYGQQFPYMIPPYAQMNHGFQKPFFF